MGRNIWLSKHPLAILQGKRGVIHDRSSVDDAEALLRSLPTNENCRELELEPGPEDKKPERGSLGQPQPREGQQSRRPTREPVRFVGSPKPGRD
jgi:hypothetical protein